MTHSKVHAAVLLRVHCWSPNSINPREISHDHVLPRYSEWQANHCLRSINTRRNNHINAWLFLTFPLEKCRKRVHSTLTSVEESFSTKGHWQNYLRKSSSLSLPSNTEIGTPRTSIDISHVKIVDDWTDLQRNYLCHPRRKELLMSNPSNRVFDWSLFMIEIYASQIEVIKEH